MTAGQVVHSPSGQPVVLGEIGQTVLLDTPRVRVWEVALAPGETQPWHLHHNPYLVLNLESSPCHMDWLNGDPPRQLNETPGGIVFRPPSPVHMLTNDGDRTYRNRLIELKDLGEEAVGDVVLTVQADPLPALPIVFDSTDVRVYGLDPGVPVALTGGTFVVIGLPDGSSRVIELCYLRENR